MRSPNGLRIFLEFCRGYQPGNVKQAKANLPTTESGPIATFMDSSDVGGNVERGKFGHSSDTHGSMDKSVAPDRTSDVASDTGNVDVGDHSDGLVWAKLIMFWIDVEYFRQQVGNVKELSVLGLELWDNYLAEGAGNSSRYVRKVLPQSELRRIDHICRRLVASHAANRKGAEKNQAIKKRPRPSWPQSYSLLALDAFSRTQTYVQIYLMKYAIPPFCLSDAFSKTLIDIATLESNPDGNPSLGGSDEIINGNRTDHTSEQLSGRNFDDKSDVEKTNVQKHNHHLIEVLSDKELSVYLEAFIANYKPDSLGGLKLWGYVAAELEPTTQYAVHLLGDQSAKNEYSEEEAELVTSETKSAIASVVSVGKRLRVTFFSAGRRGRRSFYSSSNELHTNVPSISDSTRKRVDKCLKPPKCLQKETWSSSLFRTSSNSTNSTSSASSTSGASTANTNHSNLSRKREDDSGTTVPVPPVSSIYETTFKDRLRAELLEVLGAFKQAQLDVEAEMNSEVWPHFEDSELFESMISSRKGVDWHMRKRSELQKLADIAYDAIATSTSKNKEHSADSSEMIQKLSHDNNSFFRSLRPYAAVYSGTQTSRTHRTRPEVICSLRATTHDQHSKARMRRDDNSKEMDSRNDASSCRISHFIRIMCRPFTEVENEVSNDEPDGAESVSTASKLTGASERMSTDQASEDGATSQSATDSDKKNTPEQVDDAANPSSSKQSPRRKLSLFKWGSSNSPEKVQGKTSTGLWKKISITPKKNENNDKNYEVETFPEKLPRQSTDPVQIGPRESSGISWEPIVDVSVRATGQAPLSKSDINQIVAFCCPTDLPQPETHKISGDDESVHGPGIQNDVKNDQERTSAQRTTACGYESVPGKNSASFIIPKVRGSFQENLLVVCLTKTQRHLVGSNVIYLPVVFCAISESHNITSLVASRERFQNEAKADAVNRQGNQHIGVGSIDPWEILLKCIRQVSEGGPELPPWLQSKSVATSPTPENGAFCQWLDELNLKSRCEVPTLPELSSKNATLPSSLSDRGKNLAVASLFSRFHFRSVIRVCEWMINSNAGVVLIADDANVLLDIAQGLVCCISPLKWEAAYVPHVPPHLFPSLMKLYGKGTPFLVGCNMGQNRTPHVEPHVMFNVAGTSVSSLETGAMNINGPLVLSTNMDEEIPGSASRSPTAGQTNLDGVQIFTSKLASEENVSHSEFGTEVRDSIKTHQDEENLSHQAPDQALDSKTDVNLDHPGKQGHTRNSVSESMGTIPASNLLTENDRHRLLSCVPSGTLIVDCNRGQVFLVESGPNNDGAVASNSSADWQSGQTQITEEQRRSIPRVRALEILLRQALQPNVFGFDEINGYESFCMAPRLGRTRRLTSLSFEDRITCGSRLRAIMESWLYGVLCVPLPHYAFTQYIMEGRTNIDEISLFSVDDSQLADHLIGLPLQIVVLFAGKFLDECMPQYRSFFKALFGSRHYLEWLSVQKFMQR